MTDLDLLIEAAQRGDFQRAKLILEKDSELANARDDLGATALHYAALYGHRQTAELLIEHGADVNSRDSQFGATPAGWAIEYLRERGGQLAIELDDLAYAIEAGDKRWAARFLTRFPAMRRGTDKHGKAFKQLASESGHPEIIRLFSDDQVS